jgi:hypothetical protein
MLRIAHANMLADVYVQKYNDSFTGSSLVTLAEWPPYPAGYDADLVYSGAGREAADDPLGWRCRAQVLAGLLAAFDPHVLAITECQTIQRDEMIRCIGRAVPWVWTDLCPYDRDEEASPVGLQLAFDPNVLALMSQRFVLIGDTNTLRCSP